MTNEPVDCILGVDPGLSGALAWYFPSVPDRVSVEDMPVAGGEVDTVTLAQRIEQMRPTVVFIEQVGAHPIGGKVAQFKFGAAYGAIRGVAGALKIPTHLVSPMRWKKHFNLSKDKDKSRALALRMFPAVCEKFARKKDDGRAEASLIARYGAETMGKAS